MLRQDWICSVCGYSLKGDLPSVDCPVCGADRSAFTVLSAPPVSDGTDSIRIWRCLVCQYLHEGNTPPAQCPVCRAAGTQFEPVAVEEAPPKKPSKGNTIVIVGTGIAGVSAAESARKTSPDARIFLVGREEPLPYYRLNLTRFLAGEVNAEQLVIHSRPWYDERRIELRLGREVETIDPDNKTLHIRDGEVLSYDKLILTMGARCVVPPVEGVDKKDVRVLRTLEDALVLQQLAREGERCVVVGGGVLGLEVAAALSRQGSMVTVIEVFDWLLPRQLNPAAGERLAAHIEKLGIRLICGGRIVKLSGQDRVQGMVLGSGEELPADLVVFSTGVQCNSALARQAGLEVNKGILVDNTMRTSNQDIFAAGDVAEHQGVLYGTWLPAQMQGTVAGRNAAGDDAQFQGVPRSNSLKVLDVDLFSIGEIAPADDTYDLFEERTERCYSLFVFRNALLVGAILLGDISLAARLKHLIEKQIDCQELLRGATDGSDIRQRLSVAR